MRIGVVIPAYDVAPYIGDAIESLFRQTHTDWHAVVVDDGSDDLTPDVVSRFSDRRLSLVRQPHAGVSAARNRGIAEVEAEAILFLDADDWLAPDALAVLARTLASSPRAVAAVGCYARVRCPAERPGRIYRPPAGQLLARMLVRNPFANGGHLLIRRDAIAGAGPFRTDLRYGEDWEYWSRIGLQGHFAAVSERHPLCFVRERPGSVYLRLADDPNSFAPGMQAMFANPDIQSRFAASRLAHFRRRAEAENAWVVGRELIRHGRPRDGLGWLSRSVVASPSVKRIGLAAFAAAVGLLPEGWRGPFRPYRAAHGDRH